MKGCPFCNGEVEITSCSANTARRIVKGTFACNNCGAKITLSTKYENAALDSLDAAWNRRSDNA